MLLLAAAILFSDSEVKYIDNGHLRLGVDLGKGGAIVWLSKESGPNLINDCDLGRQIQLSFYGGPVPFEPRGKQPAPTWAGLGWNPIQTGDTFGHPSRTLSYRFTKTTLDLTCIPMQWPLNDEPGECRFEVSIRLVGNTVEVTNTLRNQRSDHTPYPARPQELPAIYTNAPWHRLMSYTGGRPFTGDKLTELTNPAPASTFPWVSFAATEGWTALVDDKNDGLGVVEPGVETMSGGFFGRPGVGGSADGPTGYIAPNLVEILDWNITYRFDYSLVVGSLDAIRNYAKAHRAAGVLPDYRFERDRQHWYYANASDTGWPIRGELQVKLDAPDPQLIGPKTHWNAGDAPRLRIEAAFQTHSKPAQLFWSSAASPGFSEANSLRFQPITDGRYHTYELRLDGKPGYSGLLTGLRFDPEPDGSTGDWVRVRRIWLGR